MKKILLILLFPFIAQAQNQKIYGIGLWQYQAYTSTANGTASLLKTGKMTNTATTTHVLQGVNFSDTLLSGANSQALFAVNITPTFTTGANTNVDRVALATSSAGQVRFGSDIIPNGNGNWAGAPSLGGVPQYVYGYAGSGTILFSNAYTYNSQDAIFIGGITTTGSAYRSIGIRADNISLNTIGGGGVAVSASLSTVADPSAILDATSTTKGFLPPRMTEAQRDAISSPAEGLIIYNLTTHKLNVYTTAWEEITSTP